MLKLLPNTSAVRTLLLLWMMCLSFWQAGDAQQTDLIQSLEISGNRRTKNEYLRRFIHTEIGKQADTLLMQEDLRRLRNLPSVMNATLIREPSDSGYRLSYQIEERFTLFPVGDFGIADDNFWVGGGLMESNLFGRGLYAYGYYQYNERHTVHLIFRNPYLFGSQWGLEFQLKNLPSVEDDIWIESPIRIDFLNISLALRYEFHYENELLAGTAYRREVAEFIDPFVLVPVQYPIRKAQDFFIRYEIRKLDFVGFYIQGWKNTSFLSVLVPYDLSENPILMMQDELKLYFRAGPKTNLALRTMAGMASFSYRSFNPFIADSYYNFRGIGYRSYRGNLMALINLEIRQTLYENHWGGIQAVLFNDSGLIGISDGIFDFTLEEYSPGMQSFGGLGLRFIYKKAYDAILCIDYGVDLRNLWQGGFVMGWGQYF